MQPHIVRFQAQAPNLASLQGKSREAKQEVHTVYAIIKTGGKQYRVAEGDVITIEKIGSSC